MSYHRLSNESEKFVVKLFGGAITKDIESYIQPAPSNVILHFGTNELKTSSDPEQIAENIINLANSMKTDKDNVIISELTSQNDQLNKKAKEVNEFLTRECNNRNIDNMNAQIHRNVSGLRLNCKGTNILIKIIFLYLNKFCSS